MRGFLDGSDGKESACNAEDSGLTPKSGRTPGEGNCYPFQHTRLENPTENLRGYTVPGVAKRWT